MTLVLDAGALIQVDRGNRTILSALDTAFDKGEVVDVPTGVIGQAWRNPDRQAVLSRMLKRCNEVDLDGAIARACGQLCGRAATNDVIDASVALAVARARRSGKEVTLLTSDSDELGMLLSVLDARARIIEV
ncbi:MAG: PIN domain nuclease [bacterium]|nr:PIN domain nuclease [bacterium]MDE0290647.1 PIN domain nuclease [bacterium]MDE0439100.1 PIN domain nuclease [bacterium]